MLCPFFDRECSKECMAHASNITEKKQAFFDIGTDSTQCLRLAGLLKGLTSEKPEE